MSNDVIPFYTGTICAFEERDQIRLQIELSGDHSITLTMMKWESDPARCSLWAGDGERAFEDCGVMGFYFFLQDAGLIKKTAADPPPTDRPAA